jgi:hypothetical protein
MRSTTFVLALAALAAAVPTLTSAEVLTDWTDGIATFYGGAPDGMDPHSHSYGTKEGSCGYFNLSKDVYPFWQVAAFATSNKYFNSLPGKACGTCWEIECVEGKEFAGRCRAGAGPVTVTITDSCPECGADHMDLQALVFEKIAPPSGGRINIRYRRVSCQPPSSMNMNVQTNYGPGAWLRLVVGGTAGKGAMKNVQIKGPDGDWQNMENRWGNAWEVSKAPALPWDFRFVAEDGQAVEAKSLVGSSGQVGDLPTGVQFSLSGKAGAAPADGGK